ncbi:gamma-glutamylcyclotransferase [Halopelagius longus]|uniref:Gamma-glutamyl cyclotransferase, AIG2-like n=1 Tax=Halopelagius longus TaxID=1236180 RepID=A0A1H1DTK1_9EURY|nr:gamma-glutamylcyclotransferase [Halopelagius longus]SDQ79841.1 Gamma-glutamyl cyclotransferase, AIG2-like [Halopelagius longus]
MTDVFVYGTLTDSDRVASLLEEWSFGPGARLRGLHRVEGEYPTLLPGGSVEGRILRTDELSTLDRYEGVASGLYVRVSVPYADGWDACGDGDSAGARRGADDSAIVYVGDPARLGVEADAEWPNSGDFASRVRRFVAEERVVVHPEEKVSDA